MDNIELKNENFDERAYLQMVIDNIDAVIAICNADKIVIMINGIGRAMLREDAGMEPEELLGQPIDTVLEPMIYDGTSIVGLVAKEKVPLRRNIHYKNGNVAKSILYTALPIIDDGILKYIVATGRDMTKLIHLEEQLEKAEKLNQYYSGMVEQLTKCKKSEEIIFSSKTMENTLALATRAAMSDAPVFITGETGVGKEVVAQYIHNNGKRKDKPFIAVNCAAIPKELMESELFGYADGAFTGGKKGGKKGLLEEANGGSFFLDEVGELSYDLQAKLLRVIQEGRVRRIGSNNAIEVNIRYISATNLCREKLLDNDVFRQDLRYRLSVIPIDIPPLRERREDIIPMVEHFINVFNEKYSKEVHLSAAAYSYLCKLPWRGNVRQIKNVVERLVILSEDGCLLKDEAIDIINLDIESSVPKYTQPAVKVNNIITLSKAHEEMEDQLIAMAIKEYKTIPKVAKALGVPPSTIYRKLKK